MAMPDLSINPFQSPTQIEGGWCVACGQHHILWAWCPRNTIPTIEWHYKTTITSEPHPVGETWTGDGKVCPHCGGKHGGHTRTDCPCITRHKWTDPDTGWQCPICGRGNAPYMKYCDCYLDRYHMIRSQE